ncbi:MAG: hypothetical protein MI919_26325 [Holophagales bacterium]|nr:hypothetical protein [Holophagales bacterium]
MRSAARLVAIVALVLFATVAWAAVQASPAPAVDSVLPQSALAIAIAEHRGAGLMSLTCTVIRPVATHSQCTFFLCESYGCGAPFLFDPIDCSCHCGYQF